MAFGQFIHVLSVRLHLAPGKALFVFVKDTLPSSGLFFSFVVFCRALKVGVAVHGLITKLGLEHDLFLNNNLLSLYVKCFDIVHASKLFDEMPKKDVVSWTGMISAYVKCGENEKAIGLFNMMASSDLVPNKFTFASALRACTSAGAWEHGRHIHAWMTKCGFVSNTVLGSALIDFYSKCEKFVEAYDIFLEMQFHDVISCTTMIAAFIQEQDPSSALRLYLQMEEWGISPNEFTFVNLLPASFSLGCKCVKLVHAHIVLLGIKLNLVLKTALIDTYLKFGMIEEASKVLNQTPESDTFLWTTVIAGLTQAENFVEAIDAFCSMGTVGVSPNSYTYAGILKACSCIPLLEFGMLIHSRVWKVGLQENASVVNALVDMYMKCLRSEDALSLFKEVPTPDVILWTSLITGFAIQNQEREAVQAFNYMQAAGIQPTSSTFASLLKACSSKLDQVGRFHGCIIKSGADADIAVGNSLVDVYARFGMMEDAWSIAKTMADRDVVTYTSLAKGNNHLGHHLEALDVMHVLLHDNVRVDNFCLATFLSASAGLPALEAGKQIHCCAVKTGFEHWISVGNSLVDMYGKCGNTKDSQRMFTLIPNPNVVSWNALMAGMASNGQFASSLHCFEEMQLVGLNPDDVTFLLALYACSHGGLVERGRQIFKQMHEIHKVTATLDHYVCMVDLLGRAGFLESAAELTENMPFRPDALVYKTLLSSCKLHKNVGLGEYAAGRALELDPTDPATYVLLANMYDDAAKSNSANSVRLMLKQRGLKKNPGQSWIEIRNKLYHFTSGDRFHPQTAEMHAKLEKLNVDVRKLGYEGTDRKQNLYHSERLALAFGLLHAPHSAAIRVIKNLRICSDCHSFTRFVSILVDRDIIIRDGNRFHSFKNGVCSCGEYW
ncbi:Pentatricopeptide repeat-containing protein [Nymphaea thermarum]|nr:Pentatricopeptide repeat-containing protein [Nymphaea thermarum]